MSRYLFAFLLAFPLIAQAASGDKEAARLGWKMIDSGALVIDVRSPSEFEEGHIDGAINVPYEDSGLMAQKIGADRGRAVVLYCGSGRRAGIAEKVLEQMGYQQVFNATAYDALVDTQPDQ